jgi:serine/threonine protein kinase
MHLASAADAEFIAFQDAVAGRYSLERELGRGGMGIVYLARELRLARPVAIKVLPRALAHARPELRERFVREAQMAAQLSHPHIVPIHHVDEAGDFVFFVMTFIDGETLGERLRTRGPLTPNDAARMLREIGWALAYAHLRGIVHRDVKPDNILLERDSGRALVTDFGIAGASSSPTTADEQYVRGTVHYLSPEQASGEPVDGRSDIYSLGVVGYLALTGQLPFDGDTAASVMVAHLSKRAAPMSRIAPGVPRRLADAVERCLEKSPDDRWPSGERFADAVHAAFEGPREIPAPLRVWLTKSDRDLRLRVFLSAYTLLIASPALMFRPLLYAVTAMPFAASLIVLPEILRVRKAMSAGFSIGDLRSAMRTFVMRRHEELTYELADRSELRARTLLAFSSVAGLTAAGLFASGAANFGAINTTAEAVFLSTATAAAGIGVIGTVLAIGRSIRNRILPSVGTFQLRFWEGNWGERFMRLASRGLKTTGVAQSALPQFTEVALGRATDALYQSLPKHVRKELADVPETVRRLEQDARLLRESLDRLDDARDLQDPALDVERSRATDKLSATVTALENIRLGLLRLQIGAAPVTSVTEALAAATRIGRELEIVADAEDEVREAMKSGKR